MKPSAQKIWTRREVADAVEALISEALPYDDYLNRVPDESDDELVAEVLDLVEHIPKRGGVFGVSTDVHQEYLKRILEMVKRLRLTTPPEV